MFNLTRYFSTLSFIFIALASGLVGAYFENATIRNTVLVALTLLFLFQLLVVHRAQRILDKQSAALEESNHELDQRVQARTAELQAVVGIGQNTGDEAIIRAIIALARSLKLDTVAEGVDSDHQAGFLRAHGCDQIQGFLFGKPQPAGEFAAHWVQKTTAQEH